MREGWSVGLDGAACRKEGDCAAGVEAQRAQTAAAKLWTGGPGSEARRRRSRHRPRYCSRRGLGPRRVRGRCGACRRRCWRATMSQLQPAKSDEVLWPAGCMHRAHVWNRWRGCWFTCEPWTGVRQWTVIGLVLVLIRFTASCPHHMQQESSHVPVKSPHPSQPPSAPTLPWRGPDQTTEPSARWWGRRRGVGVNVDIHPPP